MNILIICTYFPPDNAIASVRPYMFAKYLAKKGHHVTVIRSGKISMGADNVYPIDKLGIEVYSYLGPDSPTERFLKGQQIQIKKSRISFIPIRQRKIILKIYHKLNSPREFYNRFKNAKKDCNKQKAIIDELNRKGLSYDVVFATYGELENIYAGEYASKLWNCKYILDLRDPIANKLFSNIIEYQILKRFQYKAVMASDICTTVSEELTKTLKKYIPKEEIITLYNGYEPLIPESKTKPEMKFLSFCYTGRLYEGLRNASLLFKCISELIEDGAIDRKKIAFKYAGHNFYDLAKQADRYNVKDIIKDYGYLNRIEIQKLQGESDIFVVLSWNTKYEHGVLTGKFYEGIRCNRPILALISGNDSGSELSIMQKKYNYGLCVEEAKGESDYQALKKWIKNAYELKINNQELPYTASDAFSLDFRYDVLTDKLEKIMQDKS